MGKSVPGRLLLFCLLAYSWPQAAAQETKLNAMLRHVRNSSAQRRQAGLGLADAAAQGDPTRVGLFLRLGPGVTKADLSARYPDARFTTQVGTIVTGEMSLADLGRIDTDPDIVSAEAALRTRPAMDTVRSSATDSGNFLGVVDPAVTDFGTAKGSGVIVGIVDSGIDWRHADFMVAGSTHFSRILYIWDQEDTAGPSPGGNYTYGTQWTQAQIDLELGTAPPGVVRSSDTAGHGTIVAGIAAGNGSATDGDLPAGTFVGMAPEADIIVVKTTFLDNDITDGVQYIFDRAAALGKRAVVNLSLGSDLGPHDGTSAPDTAIGTIAASSPVVVAAGNSVTDAIHASTVTNPNQTVTFDITRPAAAATFLADFWMPSGDLYTVSVATKLGGPVISAVAGLAVTTATLGTTTIDIYNTPGTHPSGAREVLVVVRETPVILPGTFFVSFTRTSNAGSGKIDGWITPHVARFSSLVSSASTVGSPAVAADVITVGSYCAKRQWTDNTSTTRTDANCAAWELGKLSDFSARGPTRDGRGKPDVAAPGEYVASVFSSSDPITSPLIALDDRHRFDVGTSMAAAVVAGMVAIDLQRFPAKSAAAVKATLQGNARSDSHVASAGSLPNFTWGYGKVTHFACLAAAISTPTSITPFVLGHSSISYTWGDSVQASGYNVYYATNPTMFIASVTDPAFTLKGLDSGTSYSIRVLGKSACGEGPAGVSVSTVTEGLPPLPAAPAAPVGTALATDRIQWSWPSVSGADSYVVRPASDTGATAIASVVAGFFHENLDPNTAYGIVVGGVNDSGTGPLSPAATRYTFAAVPVNLATTTIRITSASFNWGLNGNPATTIAHLEKSTDNVNFTEVFASSVTVAATGLLSCTSQYIRVRNSNGDGVLTAYGNVLSFTTNGSTPTAPTGFKAASAGGRRITLSWDGNPEAGPTEADPGPLTYAVYYDSAAGTVDYATTLATVSAGVTSYTTPPLAGLESEYIFALRAVNRCGIEESNRDVVAFASALASLQGVKAEVTVPKAGTPFTGNRVTVAAAFLQGTAGDTREVRFEYKPSSAAVWSLIPAVDSLRHPNPDPDSPYAIHWDVLALAATSYHLRSVATDVFGSTDPFPAVLTAVISHTSPEVSENRLGGAGVKKSQGVFNAAPNTVEAADDATDMVISVRLPAGALGLFRDTLSVESSPTTALNPPADGVDIGLRASIGLLSGQTQLVGGSKATIVFNYPDENGDGIVDGSPYRADELRMFSYDLGLGRWLQDIASSVDTAQKTVTGSTPHFSFFAVFAPATSALDPIRVYPNPFRPNNGDPDDGRVLHPSDGNSGIVFDRLPAGFNIEIFTLSGETVATLGGAGTLRRVQWNVRNTAGVDVASGVYFAVITGPGSSAVVKKLVVIR